jgi:hypothetical protein
LRKTAGVAAGVDQKNAVEFPPVAIAAENAESMNCSSATADAASARVGHNQELCPLRQGAGQRTALDFHTVKFSLAIGRSGNDDSVPGSQCVLAMDLDRLGGEKQNNKQRP